MPKSALWTNLVDYLSLYNIYQLLFYNYKSIPGYYESCQLS